MQHKKQYLLSFLFGVGVGFGVASIASLAVPSPVSRPRPAAYSADWLSAARPQPSPHSPHTPHSARTLPAGEAADEAQRRAFPT